MESKENCGVCGAPLVYATESVEASCAFCGERHSALMYCPQGHYICDSCHRHESLDVLRQVLGSMDSTSPIDILERAMSHPSVPMHGPEHHIMVPATIVAAVRNSGHQVPDGAVEKAIGRGSGVPGGWCGYCGACGAAIGVGIAVSVLGEATPLTGQPRALANEATAFALSNMLDGYPRCCKKASRDALAAAIDFLKDKMGITLDIGQPVQCTYVERNRECVRKKCPYYAV